MNIHRKVLHKLCDIIHKLLITFIKSSNQHPKHVDKVVKKTYQHNSQANTTTPTFFIKYIIYEVLYCL